MDATMYSLRIQSKGKIENLDNGFNLSGTPFSVFVRPKENTMETNVLIRCKLICDKEDGDLILKSLKFTGVQVKLSKNKKIWD